MPRSACLLLFIFAACAEGTVAIDDPAPPGAITCTPNTWDFGPVAVATCARTRITCVTRDPPLRVTTPTTAPEFVASAAPRTTRDEAIEITAQYCPIDVGRDEGTMVVSVLGGYGDIISASVALAGVGRGPRIAVDPSVLDVGSIEIGSSGQTTLRVLNAGFAALHLSEVRVPTDAGAAITVEGAPATIAPGRSTELTVTVEPTQEGPIRVPLILVSDDSGARELEVPVQAVGLPYVPECAYTVSPLALDFGDVDVARPVRRTLLVRNTGTLACTVTDVRLIRADPGLTIAPWAPVRIAPGAHAAIAVDLVAPHRGTVTGTLEIDVPSVLQPRTAVSLLARGTDPIPFLTPRVIDFGSVPVGCRTQRTVTIDNGTSTPFTSDVILDALTGLGFSVDPPSVTVAPGQSATFTVAGLPREVGLNVASVHVSDAGATLFVGLQMRGAPAGPHVDRFQMPEPQPTDVLVVVDNAATPVTIPTALAAQAAAFFAAADAARVPYQVGVTTADVSMGGGRILPLLAAQGDLITPSSAPTPADALAARLQTVGFGSGPSQGLDAMRYAVTPPLAFEHNAGFLRPGARRAVLVISATDDASVRSLERYLSLLDSLEVLGGTTLSAIVGDVPGGCFGPNGTADPALRYGEIAARTGGRLASICSNDAASSLRTVAAAVFGLRPRWTLSGVPEPGSIVVRIGGVEVPQRGASGAVEWSYDAATRAMELAPGVVLDVGADVEVTYTLACAG